MGELNRTRSVLRGFIAMHYSSSSTDCSHKKIDATTYVGGRDARRRNHGRKGLGLTFSEHQSYVSTLPHFNCRDGTLQFS